MGTNVASPVSSPQSTSQARRLVTVPAVTVRFAGDSGDGMQLVGMQFTDTSALVGNDISTLPDYPAEIRAPAGTVPGVSGYQIQFAANDIFTPGDDIDVLIAMNPAAMKSNLPAVKRGGMVIVNSDAFGPVDLKKAGYETNPLETDPAMANYRVVKVPVDTLTLNAVKETGLNAKQAARCKNFLALGLVYWLYSRPLEPTLEYINKKFATKLPAVAQANSLALRAGYNYGDTAELFSEQYIVEKAKLPPGTYRKVTGNEAVAYGLATAAHLAGKELFYGTYPITPASDILHTLAEFKNHRVVTFQAEDEIAAMGSTVGAAYGGALASTGTSGPGMALKTEAIGLGVMTELPMVIVNVQRGGPSTGLPTKTEQADLFQAIFGRNGECPVPVIAAASPTDCFDATVEAARIAVRYMTPVIVLTDGYVANGAEPWRVPDVASMPRIPVSHPTEPNGPKGFLPYKRNEDGARPWCVPGTPGLEHRIGGLEKADLTGGVSYDGDNHQKMVRNRAAKIAGVKPAGEPWFWTGPQSGHVLLMSWGGTWGAVKAATLELQKMGQSVASCHLRYLNPLPEELGGLMARFEKVIVPELNLGQLRLILQAKFLRELLGINKVKGQPFTVQDIVQGVLDIACRK